jgi:hypothetical protein
VSSETVKGKDVIAIPMSYHDEFRRDPIDSLLKYGSLPQRARQPYFTDGEQVTKVMTLPDQVCGPAAVLLNPKAPARSIVADKDPEILLNGIAEHFGAHDTGFWHVHVDLALNKKRHGDAAGLAMGRITGEWGEKAEHPNLGAYTRWFRTYSVPLVAQIIAPEGGQVYITSVVKLILLLRQVRGFNITSFSFDGFQSVEASQQLVEAGLATAGMHLDPGTGDLHGLPKAFSVDGASSQPYRELLEVVNDDRIELPDYPILKRELGQLETALIPGQAPDHPVGGSKDTADPVAGVVGYLAAYGHTILFNPVDHQIDRAGLEEQGVLTPSTHDFGVHDEDDLTLALPAGGFMDGLEGGDFRV